MFYITVVFKYKETFAVSVFMVKILCTICITSYMYIFRSTVSCLSYIFSLGIRTILQDTHLISILSFVENC